MQASTAIQVSSKTRMRCRSPVKLRLQINNTCIVCRANDCCAALKSYVVKLNDMLSPPKPLVGVFFFCSPCRAQVAYQGMHSRPASMHAIELSSMDSKRTAARRRKQRENELKTLVGKEVRGEKHRSTTD